MAFFLLQVLMIVTLFKKEHAYLFAATDAACSPNPCQHGGHCSVTIYNQFFTCTCRDGYYGEICQHNTTCNKLSAVTQITEERYVSHSEAHLCPSGSMSSSEAFVLAHCRISFPFTWKRGVNVLDNCTAIPLFTPIAVFSSDGLFNGATARSGIFFGCLSNGFWMAAQTCHEPANFIEVVNGGTGNNDPHAYYAIQ